MLELREGDPAEALEAEVLLFELQGQLLAKENGVPSPFCLYCGGKKEARDHVIPFKFTRVGPNSRRRYKEEGPIVDTCSSCNSALHDRIFTTFRNRLLFLKATFSKKAKRYGDAGDIWDFEETVELGHTLQTYIESQMHLDNESKRKIYWITRLLKDSHWI